MASWCHDPLTTSVIGTTHFRKPYPQKDWLLDRDYNAFPIEAMKEAAQTASRLGKDKKRWTESDRQYFLDIMKDKDNGRS